MEPTAGQLAARERFRQAALYGRIALADPETKALYESAARAKGVPVFSMIVGDFFHAPSIDQVDIGGYGGRAGDTIVILARDDFQVTGVSVAVVDGEGNVIESGAAVEDPPRSGRYVYTATAAVPAGTAVSVRVKATDRPGGEATAEASSTV